MATLSHADGPGNAYNVFSDGGLWANNPVLVALIEALNVAAPKQPIEVYCLGTCPMPAGEQIERQDIYRGLAKWKFGGNVATLAIDAQEFAYDHMSKKIARHLNRPCTVIRFPSGRIPTALAPYLGLDDTRTKAMNALINQARTDADMINSKCSDRGSNQEAALIYALFESAPPLSTPLFSRRS